MDPMEAYSALWNPVEPYGALQNPMEPYGISAGLLWAAARESLDATGVSAPMTPDGTILTLQPGDQLGATPIHYNLWVQELRAYGHSELRYTNSPLGLRASSGSRPDLSSARAALCASSTCEHEGA